MAPRLIFLIRHGEKPDAVHPAEPPFGVDGNGNGEIHGLTPRGWQRAGALVALFAPSNGAPPPPLATPDRLIAAAYGSVDETRKRRPHLTVAPLGERLAVDVGSHHTVGQEVALAGAILSADNRATLVCWEHAHVPLIAARIPVAASAGVPTTWPENRFDLVWCFERSADATTYAFSVVGQRLLSGDADP